MTTPSGSQWAQDADGIHLLMCQAYGMSPDQCQIQKIRPIPLAQWETETDLQRCYGGGWELDVAIEDIRAIAKLPTATSDGAIGDAMDALFRCLRMYASLSHRPATKSAVSLDYLGGAVYELLAAATLERLVHRRTESRELPERCWGYVPIKLGTPLVYHVAVLRTLAAIPGLMGPVSSRHRDVADRWVYWGGTRYYARSLTGRMFDARRWWIVDLQHLYDHPAVADVLMTIARNSSQETVIADCLVPVHLERSQRSRVHAEILRELRTLGKNLDSLRGPNSAVDGNIWHGDRRALREKYMSASVAASDFVWRVAYHVAPSYVDAEDVLRRACRMTTDAEPQIVITQGDDHGTGVQNGQLVVTQVDVDAIAIGLGPIVATAVAPAAADALVRVMTRAGRQPPGLSYSTLNLMFNALAARQKLPELLRDLASIGSPMNFERLAAPVATQGAALGGIHATFLVAVAVASYIDAKRAGRGARLARQEPPFRPYKTREGSDSNVATDHWRALNEDADLAVAVADRWRTTIAKYPTLHYLINQGCHEPCQDITWLGRHIADIDDVDSSARDLLTVLVSSELTVLFNRVLDIVTTMDDQASNRAFVTAAQAEVFKGLTTLDKSMHEFHQRMAVPAISVGHDAVPAQVETESRRSDGNETPPGASAREVGIFSRQERRASQIPLRVETGAVSTEWDGLSKDERADIERALQRVCQSVVPGTTEADHAHKYATPIAAGSGLWKLRAAGEARHVNVFYIQHGAHLVVVHISREPAVEDIFDSALDRLRQWQKTQPEPSSTTREGMDF